MLDSVGSSVESWVDRLGGRLRRSEPEIDPHLADALSRLSVAIIGEPGRLSDCLVGLRAEQDWYGRGLVLDRARRAARERADWLHNWARNDPDNPDLAQLHADVAVARGLRAAPEPDTEELIDRAVRLNPGDPTPWATRLDQARALGLPHDQVQHLVDAASEVAPEAYSWRRAAVEYLSPAWCGSAEEMWEYACECAESAPRSRLLILPLEGAVLAALSEHRPAKAWIAEAAPVAADYLSGLDRDGPELVETANSLAAGLFAAGNQHARVFLEFAADRIDSAAWSRFEQDPVQSFRQAQKSSRARRGRSG